MKVIFVRHGKDDDRYRGGWSMLDLVPEGAEQAKRLAGHLKQNACEYQICRILSSDLPRTMTTARIITGELGLKIEEEPRLRETNNGDLAGMLNEVALVQYPGLFFSSLEMDEAYPNGESPREFYERISRWFREFCEQCRDLDENILVVTHGGVINIIYHIVKRIEWSNKAKGFRVSNCGLHVLDLEEMRFEVENKTDFSLPATAKI